MDCKTTAKIDPFRRSFSDLAEIFGIDGNILFTVMLACAVRGMGDWTGAGVVRVIHLLKQGEGGGRIIEDLMMERSITGLN